jgi:LacI family transcriptional regulator
MMTGLHDPARELRALRAFVEHRADGIVLASCVSDPTDVHMLVPQRAVVFVKPEYPALARTPAPDRGVLGSDDDAGMTAAVLHLLDRGYRRIAYVGAGGGASDLLRRSAVAKAFDGVVDEALDIYDAGLAGWRDPSMVADALARDRPDAVICYDDKLALALMDALRLTTLDVPGDLAVVGFDGITQSSRSRPRLTTIAVPSAEIGRRAVGMLVASLRDGSAPPSEVMPVRLVIGETTPQREALPRRPQTAAAVAGAMRGA